MFLFSRMEGTLLTLVLLALPMSLVASIDGILLRIPKIWQRHSRAFVDPDRILVITLFLF